MTTGDATTGLLERLEAMAARLDAQAAEIERLKARNAGTADVSRAVASAVPDSRMIGLRAERPTTRRGLLQGALAAGAAVTALAAAQTAPAHAADPNDILSNGNTFTPGGAALINANAGSLLSHAFLGANTNGAGFANPNARIGVRGSVSGTDPSNLRRYGVYGHVNGQSSDAGVYGESVDAAGVRGISTNWIGVFARSVNSFGIVAETTSGTGILGTSTQQTAIQGVSGAFGPGFGGPYGVVGTSALRVGVFGSSTSNVGVSAGRLHHAG